MDKKIITFSKIEIEKHYFVSLSQRSNFFEDVDFDKILPSNKVSFSEEH